MFFENAWLDILSNDAYLCQAYHYIFSVTHYFTMEEVGFLRLTAFSSGHWNVVVNGQFLLARLNELGEQKNFY